MPDSWKPTWDVTTIPDDRWRSENARRVASRAHPKLQKLRACPHCGDSMPTNVWKMHKGRCAENPRVKAILAAHAKEK